MGGRGAGSGKSGVKSPSQWLNAMQSGKFEFVKTKKKLKKEVENSTGVRQKSAKKNLSNYNKARDRHTELKRKAAMADREKYEKRQADVKNKWRNTTTTTYQRFAKRQTAKADEFFWKGR